MFLAEQDNVVEPLARRSGLRARGGFRSASGAGAGALRRRMEIPGRAISSAHDRGGDPGRMWALPSAVPAPDRGQGNQGRAGPERKTRHSGWCVILGIRVRPSIKFARRAVLATFIGFPWVGGMPRLFASRQKRC